MQKEFDAKYERRQKRYEQQRKKDAAEYEQQRKKDAAEYEQQRKKDAAEYEQQRKKDVAEYEQQQKKDAAKYERRQKRYEQQRKKDAAEYKQRQKEYEQQRAKVAAEADARLKKTEITVSGIGSNNGYFAEDYFFNALYASKSFAGSKYDYVSKNIHYREGQVEDEFDIVMYNGTSIVIVETKYRVHPDFLQTLTTKKVQNFRALCPTYAKHTIYLGVASMSFRDEVIAQAKLLGIGLIRAQGDTIEYDTEHIKAY
jgi:Holliday junction resolvase-like predicted endonuclease